MIGRRKLGPLDVSAIALGCMSMTPIYGQPNPDEAIATLHRATDVGIDFIDTSDAYGANGANEELVGRALQGRREKYILATKFGNIRLPDGRPGAKATRNTSSTPARRASSGSAPTLSTCISFIGSTTPCRSRIRSAP
jgi:aryl-alcohol dehydrogenase-like predicted oxidoreductase